MPQRVPAEISCSEAVCHGSAACWGLSQPTAWRQRGATFLQDGHLVLLWRLRHSGHCCRWGATPLQDAYLVHDKVMYAMLERAGAKMSDDGVIKAKLQNQTVTASNQTLLILQNHRPPKAVPACLFTRLPVAGHTLQHMSAEGSWLFSLKRELFRWC